MTKVKTSKADKKAGTVSVKAQKAVVSDGKLIYAVRDGRQRSFTPQTWDLLPPDKQGWTLSSEKPAEIQQTPPPPVVNDDTKAFDEALANYLKVFGEKPADGLTIDQLETLIKDKLASDVLVDHIVTQEDLDLNPELAASGAKVGDTIQIPKEEGGTE